MNARKLRVAVATDGQRGLEDTVSEVFGRANTLTVIDLNEEVDDIVVIQNQAKSYKHGAGPLVVKTLADSGVKAVIAKEFGPGVTSLLSEYDIATFTARPGISVAEALKLYKSLKTQPFFPDPNRVNRQHIALR